MVRIATLQSLCLELVRQGITQAEENTSLQDQLSCLPSLFANSIANPALTDALMYAPERCSALGSVTRLRLDSPSYYDDLLDEDEPKVYENLPSMLKAMAYSKGALVNGHEGTTGVEHLSLPESNHDLPSLKAYFGQIAKLCPRLKSLDFSYLRRGQRLKFDDLAQLVKTLPADTRLVDINFRPRNRQEVDAYCKLFPKHGVSSLDLTAMRDLTQEELEHWIQVNPHLSDLSLSSRLVTRIHVSSWMEVLSSENCPNLETIIASKVEAVYCRDCPKLTRIHAPAAEHLDFTNCLAIQTIEVPNATIRKAIERRY